MIDLRTLVSEDARFEIRGVDQGDLAGISFSSAGDVEGDGIGNILIGATQADGENDTTTGATYQVWAPV